MTDEPLYVVIDIDPYGIAQDAVVCVCANRHIAQLFCDRNTTELHRFKIVAVPFLET